MQPSKINIWKGLLFFLSITLHATATKGQNAHPQPEQKPFTHWIFKTDKTGNPYLRYFTNRCSNCMIDRAVVDTRGNMLYVLTRSGIIYDSTRLAFKAGTAKQFDAFAYIRKQLNTSLDKLNKLREQVRKNANDPGKRIFNSKSKQPPAWLAELNKCATPLEQLEMLDHIGQALYETVHYLDYDLKNLETKTPDSSKKHFIEEDLKAGTRKLTVYENPDRFSAYTHAILDTARKKIYFSRLFAGIADSISVQDNSIAELEKGAINVFYLYRGWLEGKLYELDKWTFETGPVFRTILSGFIKEGADSLFIAAWKEFSDEQVQKVKAIRTKINQSIATLAWPDPHKLFAGASYLTGDNATVYTQTRGLKRYELTDHRGNVLTTISDRKIPANDGSVGSMVTYYKADILSANDHYPFGMMMPGRNYNKAGTPDYRYGFNGKENDDDVKNGEGMQQDYGMRIYDPRLGRFLSVDPIAKEYPELTPYQFASNTPIWAIDLDGLEKYVTHFFKEGKDGKLSLNKPDKIEILNNTSTPEFHRLQVNKGSVKLTNGKNFDINRTYTLNSEVTLKGRNEAGNLKSAPPIRSLSDDDLGRILAYSQVVFSKETEVRGFKDAMAWVLGTYGSTAARYESVGSGGNGNYGLLDFKHVTYDLLGIDKSNLLEINGVVYNPNEAGNYLWGMTLTFEGTYGDPSDHAEAITWNNGKGRHDEAYDQKAINAGEEAGRSLKKIIPTDNSGEIKNAYQKYKDNKQAETDYSTLKKKQKK